MTIMELLKAKSLSKYSLSKISGIPWATLCDLCSGKTSLNRCSVHTLSKLSKALELSMEELLELKAEPCKLSETGKPADKTYLETNLSPHLFKAIDDYVQGEKDQVSYMDCLWGELYGSINADLWSGRIAEEQASYLRGKYLYGEEQGEDDDD